LHALQQLCPGRNPSTLGCAAACITWIAPATSFVSLIWINTLTRHFEFLEAAVD
jgi:hypothetical protein